MIQKDDRMIVARFWPEACIWEMESLVAVKLVDRLQWLSYAQVL